MYWLNSPTVENTTSLGTKTVRRSMRIANKKPILYSDSPISKTEKLRDLLKMEISPSRQLKNLTIEARHTLSLEESKKKRLKFEQSLFLPNNKKRRDVLKYFIKKTVNANKTKKTQKNCYLNSNELNKELTANKSFYDSDISSESSDQSDRGFPMKRNLFNSKNKSNEELVATETEETETSEEMPFPSYVAYRTKGNKLKLVQHKVDQIFSALDTEGKTKQATTSGNKSKTTTEMAESPNNSIESENPSISNTFSAEHASSGVISKSILSPNSLIDLTKNSESIEESRILTQSARKPPCQSDKSNKMRTQSTPTKVVNNSPDLPSNSSNSMEFLMQSTASSDSVACSPDCWEMPNLAPSTVTHNDITDSSKPDQQLDSERSYLMKASSPKPLSVIVSNEKLLIKFSPNRSQLIQDAKVQSSTASSNLMSYNEWVKKSKSNDVMGSTSSTEKQDTQSVPIETQSYQAPPSNYEYNLQYNCTQVSYNDEASNEHVVSQPSAQNQVPYSNSKLQDSLNSKRQSQIVENGSRTAPTDEQQCMSREIQTGLMGTFKPQSNMHGQRGSRDRFGVPNIGLNSQNYGPRICETQKTSTQQPQTQASTILQDMPNCSRYFTPFYLQRPSVARGVETNPSTLFVRPSAEKEQSGSATTKGRRKKQPLKTSRNTQAKTQISPHFHQTKFAMETHGRNLQYPHNVNHQIGAGTEQIFSHSQPAHANDQNNHMHMHSRKPYNTASKSNQGASMEHQHTGNISAHSTAPAFHSNPYCSLIHPPYPGGILRNQYPFQPIQQQDIHSHQNHNVPNASNFQHSPHHTPNQNNCGYPPMNESFIRHGISHQPYYGQTYFPDLHSLQHCSTNQTSNRNEFNQIPNNCRNFQPPNLANDDVLSYRLDNQNPIWEHNRPPVVPPSHHPHHPSLEQRPIDANNWLNDRFQQAIRPPDRNERPTWFTRPQEPTKPISTSPVNIDSWVRARTQQAARPSELTNEQRIAQLEAVVNSFSSFVDNFRGFNNNLDLTAEAVPLLPPPQVTRQHPQPWESMRVSSPIGRNITTQPVPDSRTTWRECNNPMTNMEMDNNTGYPRNNVASVHSMRMDGNTANQHPVQQPLLSHQVNAADSTTGGNSTNCLDLRSYRPIQLYNQPSHPHHTPESFKNQYAFYNTH